jgi:hypothetical protein
MFLVAIIEESLGSHIDRTARDTSTIGWSCEGSCSFSERPSWHGSTITFDNDSIGAVLHHELG